MAKIIWRKVKSNNLNIRIFYKFLLNIKPRYICCHLNKQINKKKPIRFSHAWSLQKPHYLIGWLRENSWYSSFNFLKARRDQVRAISDRNWKMCVMVFKIELLSVCASASSPCILLLFFFVFCFIGIYSMQGWTANTRHGVTRNEAQKRLQDTENLFRKNLQLKDVC